MQTHTHRQRHAKAGKGALRLQLRDDVGGLHGELRSCCGLGALNPKPLGDLGLGDTVWGQLNLGTQVPEGYLHVYICIHT